MVARLPELSTASSDEVTSASLRVLEHRVDLGVRDPIREESVRSMVEELAGDATRQRHGRLHWAGTGAHPRDAELREGIDRRNARSPEHVHGPMDVTHEALQCLEIGETRDEEPVGAGRFVDA